MMVDEKNPWERKPQGPPDLLKLFQDFFNKKRGDGKQPNANGHFEISAMWIWGIVALLVFIWVLSGIYIVDQAQQAVVLRLGQYVETVGPGPHWLPTFIESETKVDIEQIRNFQYQSEMLTKDENIVNVSLAVQYRIDDPRHFLFNVDNPVNSLQQATASALRQAVGQMTLDSILTTGRTLLSDDVAKQLAATVATYQMGLQVTDLRLLPAKPPEAVTDAFDDAIKAREDEQSAINRGEAYARKVTSQVKGDVAKLNESAEAYRQEVVLQAQGDVARYNAMLKPYLATPQVTRERMYLDAVQDVLSRTNNVIVDSGINNVLYLPLDQMLKARSSSAVSSDASAAGANSLKSANNQSGANKVAVDSHLSPDDFYGKPRPSYSTVNIPAQEQQP